MRRTYNAQILHNKDGDFLGVNLGADYCAEHEWGIKELSTFFSLNQEVMGIDRCRINSYDSASVRKTQWTEKKMQWVGLYINSSQFWNKDVPLKTLLPRPYKFVEDEVCAAWDSSSLGIVVHKSNAWIIDKLLEALESNNLAIMYGYNAIFKKDGGLRLVVIPKLSSAEKQALQDEHEDKSRLLEAVEKTGIQDYLKSHGKSWYALSPAWYTPLFRPQNRTLVTRHKVIFFLNPQQQSKYNCGWFTVEELKAWAHDKGVVVK